MSANFKPQRTAAASRGFLGIPRRFLIFCYLFIAEFLITQDMHKVYACLAL